MATVQMVASGEEIFQLLKDGTIKRFTGTRDYPLHWTQLDANTDVKGIAVGDKLYKRHVTGEIFVYNRADWEEIYSEKDKDVKGPVEIIKGPVEIVAAGASIYQIHKSTSRILIYDDEIGWWVRLDGDNMQIAADQDSLYTRSTDGHIYQFDQPRYGRVLLDGNSNAAEIVAGNGYLYQRDHDGQVYRCLKEFWDRLGGDKTTVQIAAGSAGLYRRDTNGQVWEYIDRDRSWKLIDKSHDNVDIVVAKWLYVRTENSSIYRYTGANWKQLQ